MNIWHYHPQTKILIGEGKADASPLDPGVFLLPAFATSEPPPTKIPGYEIIFDGAAWGLNEIPPPPEPPPEPPPAPPLVPQDVSMWQFMMAAWKMSFITQAEALAAVKDKVMPPAFAAALAGLPDENQAEAQLKFAGITRMVRADPLFALVVAAGIATDAQIDGVFTLADSIT